MKPGTLHLVCAHPVAIAWVLFAGGLNALVLNNLAGEYTWPALLLDPKMACWLALLCAIMTLVCWLPANFVFKPVSALCARCNGAPFQLGDRVRVLTGKHRGKVATVDQLTRGQGGWPLARLDLDKGSQQKFRDLFEEHVLLRLHPRST